MLKNNKKNHDILITMQILFENIKTIAIVGLSDNPEKPSYEVGAYLQEKGFIIIPVNPQTKATEILGQHVYQNLLSIPKEIKIDVVDIFRKSEFVFPHVKETVIRGDAHTIWLQEGISHREAEDYAKEHGLTVISNFCIMKSYKNR